MQKKKKICAVYGEGAMTGRICQEWFVKFCVGQWRFLTGQCSTVRVDQLKLISDQDINGEQPMLYHAGDSGHTKNIQVKCWKSFAPAWLCWSLWCLGSTLCSVAQSCPALWDPIDCILPGSSVHGILQARIGEWIAIPSSRASSQPRDWIQASHISCIIRWILFGLPGFHMR